MTAWNLQLSVRGSLCAVALSLFAGWATADPAALDCEEHCDRSGAGIAALLYLAGGLAGAVTVGATLYWGPGTILNLLRGRRWDDSRGVNSWLTVLMVYPVVMLVSVPALMVIGLIDRWISPVSWVLIVSVLGAWWAFLIYRFSSTLSATATASASAMERSDGASATGVSPRPTPPDAPGRDVRRGDIREVSSRAVHGRAPFSFSDTNSTVTPEQRLSIAEYVGRSNDLAVQQTRQTTTKPHEPASTAHEPEPLLPRPGGAEQDLALRRALSNLAAVSREQRADLQSQIRREVEALEKRDLPIGEVIVELQRIAHRAPFQ